MKKHLSVMLSASVILAGCTTDYQKEDIEKYVRDHYKISGFSVSEEGREIKDEDNYTDYLWEVKEKDGTVFHVLDDYYWGMEAMTNSLYDDRNDVHVMQDMKDADLGSFELMTEEEEHMVRAWLHSSFKNRTELQSRIEEYNALLESYDKGFEIAAEIIFENPLRNVTEYVIDEGDVRIGGWNRKKADIKEAEKKYLLTCMDYGFEENLKEFSEEEIIAAAKEQDTRLLIVQDDETVKEYDDLIACPLMYGVSFAVFYEVLKREGYEPQGNANHYTVANKDGTVYEISYDFLAVDEEGRMHYYYLQNGERVFMEAYFYNHFETNEIREMFGLNIYEKWQYERMKKEQESEDEDNTDDGV